MPLITPLQRFRQRHAAMPPLIFAIRLPLSLDFRRHFLCCRRRHYAEPPLLPVSLIFSLSPLFRLLPDYCWLSPLFSPFHALIRLFFFLRRFSLPFSIFISIACCQIFFIAIFLLPMMRRRHCRHAAACFHIDYASFLRFSMIRHYFSFDITLFVSMLAFR